MPEVSHSRFESLVLPHLDAGFNLARWMLKNEAAAQDVTQEAAIRALRYFDSFKGGAAKPWFLGIVRNACFDHMSQRHGNPVMTGFDDEALDNLQAAAGNAVPDAAAFLDNRRLREQLDAAIAALAPPLREVIVLREMEDLDYAQIAQVACIPVGTVMSRLSRARNQLRQLLATSRQENQL